GISVTLAPWDLASLEEDKYAAPRFFVVNTRAILVQKPIVVVGSSNIDLVASAERIPQAGETVIGKGFHTFHGGKGANQAVVAARIGYPVFMVGNVGDDGFGAELRQGLVDDGVDTTFVSTVPSSSGVAVI